MYEHTRVHTHTHKHTVCAHTWTHKHEDACTCTCTHTINHELLIAKLHAYGLTKPALKVLYSYLRNRWHRTKINTSFSTWKELLSGIPQGSILEPLLFNIYLNDLFFILDLTDVCNYADDTALHACDKELPCLLTTLGHDMASVKEWFEINYMKLNFNSVIF